jgi:isopenicillin N synthase-like dioxygenase
MPVADEITSPAPEQAYFHTLSFSSLLDRDERELAILLTACENDGFFYLDLRDWESGSMLHNLQQAGQITKQWFDQPLDRKLETETLSDSHG